MEKKREDYLKEAGTKPEDYQSKFDPQIQQMAQDLVDRKPFTYDFNADPLYQQYRDQYTQAGQQAMLDTMGNAAALSGGYGNSYAATAANQAYGQYMTQLNNVIPQLYDAAYNRYVNEENTLRNNLTMLQGLDDTAYGRWMDRNNLYLSNRDFYNSNFENDRSYQLSQDQFDYQKEQDIIDNTFRQDQFDYQKGQDALNRQAASEQATAQAAAQQAQAAAAKYDVSSVPSSVTKKLDSLNSDADIESYIERLVDSNVITPEQGVALSGIYESGDTGGTGDDGKKKNKVTTKEEVVAATGYTGVMTEDQFNVRKANDDGRYLGEYDTYYEYLDGMMKKYG